MTLVQQFVTLFRSNNNAVLLSFHKLEKLIYYMVEEDKSAFWCSCGFFVNGRVNPKKIIIVFLVEME